MLLDSPRKAPPNCEWLGYELLAADEHSTGHHSWLCNGIEEVARSRGYSLARDELFSSYADAKVLAHDLTTGTVNAEPGLWLPWRVADCADLFNA